ncbi:hypothetical protein [Burkholderia multivorans]|uniref:hypothetical protein n=1 Tax=Burkholderia multivorans TaxID=87883 RepID=UPI001C267326|nr:hypothetical protein [Burkholderia multivorans]MBU9574178.1 hypothetical protein [Burkholderia multivorans]
MSNLESNAAARAYFERANRHGKAAYRRALADAGLQLPSWASDKRRGAIVTTTETATNVTTLSSAANVTTLGESAIEPTVEKVESLREFLARRRAEQEAAQTAQKPVEADDTDEVLNALDDD